MKCLVCLCLISLCFVTPVPKARADIFQWEYINPANPGLGRQQSTTLAPGGEGVSGVPGAHLGSRDLTMAYLIGADLTKAYAEARISPRRISACPTSLKPTSKPLGSPARSSRGPRSNMQTSTQPRREASRRRNSTRQPATKPTTSTESTLVRTICPAGALPAKTSPMSFLAGEASDSIPRALQ